MKTTRLFSIFILFISYQMGISQDSVLYSKKFTEMTTEEDKMKIYLDTIDEYLYRDVDLTSAAFKECQAIVANGATIGDSLFFEYIISQIYFEYSKANPLGAFKIITENEGIINRKKIRDKQIGNFNYLKCFTLHSLGDLETAQKEYYSAIEKGKLTQDTAWIIRNMYSLGQLFNDDDDHEAAISSFLKVNEYTDKVETRASTCALNNIELCEAYMKLEQYEDALLALDRAEEISQEANLEILRSDILMFRGNVYLGQNKIDAAEKVYKQLLSANQGAQDQNNFLNAQRFLGDLYLAKKMYPEALKVTEQIFENADSTNLGLKIESMEKAYKTSQEMNDFEKAFGYLLSFNNLNAEKIADEKRQKTAYLKIKYDSEQTEMDNAILSAELVKNKAERRYLYTLIILVCLVLAILFGAFYQKAKYNKSLEAEVQKRTVKLIESNTLLNKTNKELDEFNRILSHDLKEPLRSIISFSQLANRDISNTEKVKEYLNIVATSGDQLHQLIEDVNIFQTTNTIDANKNASIDIQKMLNNIAQQVQKNYPNKELRLNTDNISDIFGVADILKPIFRNLIDNAVKYNEQGVTVINIRYALKNQKHQFEIEDNGIGIAPEYHSRIFEMFKRLNVRETYIGSGLGLSIVRKLIEKAGGEISLVQSQEQKGSTFLFSYPVIAEIS